MPERYLGQSLGRFRVDSVIGSGGFAWVYRGYDPELEIPVAIKVLKPQFAGEENFETRFRREASTAAKLRHPNIIRILAVGRQEDAVYFVMDFLPHGLVDRLRMIGTLPDALLIRLGMDVSAALAFAHREGVIHRDIKTDNILFDEHGNAIVADFGIARAVSGYTQQTGTNMVVGTPQYFSPEQARGLALDGRADIYSLGVTLFKAATGVLPFGGEDWYDIARQHIEDAPPKPRSFNPAISKAVEAVILKCLEKDPNNRYPTGDALHGELALHMARSGETSGERTIVISSSGIQAFSTPPRRSLGPFPLHSRLGRRVAILSGLTATASLALILSSTRNPPNAAPRPAPAARESTPNGSPPALAPATPSDSAPLEGDSIIAPLPRGGRALVIVAPPEAAISVNGRLVGRGTWRSTDVAQGAHLVVATLGTAEGCPTARDTARVNVAASGVVTQRLEPRACGQLSIDAIQSGARFTITPSPSGPELQGVLPVAKPIVLPSGPYTIKVSAPYCADYTNQFTIAAAKTHRERIRLICST